MIMKGNTAAGTCSFEERLMVMVRVGRCGESLGKGMSLGVYWAGWYWGLERED